MKLRRDEVAAWVTFAAARLGAIASQYFDKRNAPREAAECADLMIEELRARTEPKEET